MKRRHDEADYDEPSKKPATKRSSSQAEPSSPDQPPPPLPPAAAAAKPLPELGVAQVFNPSVAITAVFAVDKPSKKPADEPSTSKARPTSVPPPAPPPEQQTKNPTEADSSTTQPPPSPPPPEEATKELSQAEPSSSQPTPMPEDEPSEPEPLVPELGEDVVFEVLRRADQRTLAAAACVSRRWRRLAEDERLWEAVCVREWASLGCSEQQLRVVVLALGGFRRLHAAHLRPLHRGGGSGGGGGAAPRWGRQRPQPTRWGRDEVLLSLSLLSIGFFEKMTNPKDDKKNDGNDNNKNRGSGCA